jgi:hypothetical protein
MRYPELRLGIELEYERYHGDFPELAWWRCERDASLRNGGVEYISNPLLPEDLDEALDEVQESIEDNQLEASWRCGGHTHVNAMYWTFKELLTYTTLYALVEPYIFGNFAPGRESNHFCVPLWSNHQLIDRLAHDAVKLRAKKGMAHSLQLLGCNKYSALNFKPLKVLGTIEFRHIPSTTNMAAIQNWCAFLMRSVAYAKTFSDPESVVAAYEDNGIENMLENLGLHTCEIDRDTTKDAYIAANMVIGHDPRKWQDLDWTMPEPLVWRDELRDILALEDEFEIEDYHPDLDEERM